MQITQSMVSRPNSPLNKYSNMVSFGKVIKITDVSVPYCDYFNLKSINDFIVSLKKLLNSNKINSYSLSECVERAKTYVKYDLILKQCGFDDIKPKLNINEQSIGPFAFFDVPSATINLNGYVLNKHCRNKKKKIVEHALKHELSHVRQFIDIVRCEDIGIKGLRQVLKRYLISYTKDLELEKKGIEKVLFSKFTSGVYSREDLIPMYNRLMQLVEEIKDKKNRINGGKDVLDISFYQKAIDKFGIIEKNSPEYKKAKSYINAFLRKIYYDQNKLNELRIEFERGLISKDEFVSKRRALYNSNPLEADAFFFDYDV